MIDKGPAAEPPLIDTGVETLLADCKLAYDLGFVPAVYEAVRTARKHGKPEPSWAVDAMVKILEEVLLTRNRSGRVSKFRSELMHFQRWSMVLTAQVTDGLSLEKAYKKVQKLLIAEGNTREINAIKKSYKRIQKRMVKEGDERRIYEVLLRAQDRLLDLEEHLKGQK